MASRILNLDGLSKIKLDKDLQESSFDRISRYYITARIINALSPSPKPRVLDVGGLGSILPRIIKSPVTIFDTEPNISPNYIQGDATKMKLSDSSYDVVISCDVLEHIPKTKRSDFVDELIRVSSDLVILCAPFDTTTNATANAEKAMNDFYIQLNGKPHRWLQEHQEAGLPTESEMDTLLLEQGLSYIKIGHTDLNVWKALVGSNFLSESIEHQKLREQIGLINTFYNNSVVDDDFSDEHYRLFYVISKYGDLKLIKGKTFGKALARKTLLDKVHEIYRDSLAIVGKQAVEEKLRADKLDASIKPLENINNLLNNELSDIKNSKSWKVVEKIQTTRHKLKRNKPKP